ncbi:NAD(P)/FAD-dependent oxidoreductase [Haliscomenobacter hydrossis]|uniref:NADH:ubiquinone reductase (non-electrogenic) n=1 Tax=Haliscomenobacter hydrossis (strain ATCC 27775 / DSM 1100 / LMG 10767 / O) TaxID=760192 RepID=F4L523_HALH1|nr:NAD(P)/FAD-dependent oxidoreductase [Haliscomenobacter hydrossis]AEE48744.1 NADH dehydrogenase (ubiquinone) [Haliscomenobacter hydrossis DSM 1100]
MDANLPILPNHPRVVIIGGGFAGLAMAKKLRKQHFQVVLLDRNNYYTFQPLLYQVATGGLEPDSIAYPLRKIFQGNPKLSFRMAEVLHIKPEQKVVETTIGDISYDHLVVATGSQTNFFSFADQEEHMMGLKSVPEALNLRSFILQNFEKATVSLSTQAQDSLINIAIVGGGPTGVELAGALAEMKRFVFPKDYPDLDMQRMRIVLLEATPKLLGGMSEAASARALKDLQTLGVEVNLNAKVSYYDGSILITEDGFRLPTETLIWAAGVKGQFPSGISKDKIVGGNRIQVDAFNRVSDHEGVYVLGDAAAMITPETPRGYPMMAPVAIQQGQQLAANLIRSQKGQDWKPFKYLDKGTMATIGRNRAVVNFLGQTFHGIVAWLMWMFVHIMYLVGFRNKIATLMGWIYNYLTYDRALRLIIRPFARSKSPQVYTKV